MNAQVLQLENTHTEATQAVARLSSEVEQAKVALLEALQAAGDNVSPARLSTTVSGALWHMQLQHKHQTIRQSQLTQAICAKTCFRLTHLHDSIPLLQITFKCHKTKSFLDSPRLNSSANAVTTGAAIKHDRAVGKHTRTRSKGSLDCGCFCNIIHKHTQGMYWCRLPTVCGH